jgi:hypothetical protein
MSLIAENLPDRETCGNVILSGGEAGARDLTAAEGFDGVDGSAFSARSAGNPVCGIGAA